MVILQIDDIAQTGDALVDIEIADGDKDSSDSDSSSDSDAEVQELEAINVGEGRDIRLILKSDMNLLDK